MEPVIDEIVSQTKILGLEMDNNETGELEEELTTEQLMELQTVSQREVVEHISLGEEDITAST